MGWVDILQIHVKSQFSPTNRRFGNENISGGGRLASGPGYPGVTRGSTRAGWWVSSSSRLTVRLPHSSLLWIGCGSHTMAHRLTIRSRHHLGHKWTLLHVLGPITHILILVKHQPTGAGLVVLHSTLTHIIH
jgi:hypothetical protein